MSTFEKDLNDEQGPAVFSPDGPTLVLAGAGSGKTRVLTYRAAHLLARGVPPPRLLLLTFTKKASQVMQRRLSALMGDSLIIPWSGTFHHIGYRLIREFGSRIGIEGPRTLLDREDQRDLIKEIRDEVCGGAGTDDGIPPAAAILNVLSLSANLLVPVETLVFERSPWLIPALDPLVQIQELYNASKREFKVLDFDDLLLLWLRILETLPDTAALLQDRFRHVLVDEYQDTNPLQSSILDHLAKGHRNLFVVGDDSQSIYSFRGAEVENILTFSERYPEARTFRLEKNYRSTPNILNLANRIILHNTRQIPKTLYSPRPSAESPTLVRMFSDSDQSTFVVRTVERMVDRGTSPGEIAILYRAHYLSLPLQLALSRKKIPFHLTSGLKFYEQAHIKDILAFLRVLENGRDQAAWKRVLRMIPKVGLKTAEKVLSQLGKEDRPTRALSDPLFLKALPSGVRPGLARAGERVAELQTLREEDTAPGAISRLVHRLLETGYREHIFETFEDPDSRISDILALAAQISSETDLSLFLAELALLDAGSEDPGSDGPEGKVVLSTIHQAKGLEWDSVFLLSLNEGIFPSNKSKDLEHQLEEERRLFYVAVTRARQDLFLCVPSVTGFGGGSPMPPSRFIAEIGEDHMMHKTYDSWND